MSAVPATTYPPAGVAAQPAPLATLAAIEARRFARHPLFLAGLGLTVLASAQGPEPATSTFMLCIVPAAAIGLFGLVVAAGLTRSASHLARAGGRPPVPERTQTAALLLACLVPFASGLVWFGWAAWAALADPPPPHGFPFGPVGTGWKLAVLFGEGAIPALGGPVLGVVVGRWWPRRGAAAFTVVGLVTASILMQGLFEALRTVRVVMPFTYWGGPFGVPGDDMRMILLPGSPQAWVVYLMCLCGLGCVAALWHDPEARTRRLMATGAVLAGAAVLAAVLAAGLGLDTTVVNPLPSGG